MKKVILVLMMLTISGCAHHYAGGIYDDPYGFFSGIWHGLIFPLTLTVNLLSWVLSLFNVSFLHDIEIIGRPNTGLFYYLGFVIGLASTSSTGARN